MTKLALLVACCVPLIACNGDGSGDASGATDVELEAAPPVLPRLTSAQYRNTLTDIFGEALPALPTPEDTNPYLFYSIGATSTSLSELGTQQYTDAAIVASDWLFADTSRWTNFVGCTPEGTTDPCIINFLMGFGQKLFRRPMSTTDVESWLSVMRDTSRGDVARGLRFTVYGMLQSPNFLYRSETGEPDPANSDRYRYTSFEMAERLSFLLWNTGPDAELLAAAGRNELTTSEGIYEQALRLLESDRSRIAVQDFFSRYLDLGGLDELERSPERYPLSTETLPDAMRNEIRLLVDDHVFRRDTDIRELFSYRRTFVNQELANLYGVDAPGASAIAFVPVELPADGPRAGFLTSAAFLSMNAHETETSPTLRGKFIRERVLCELVSPPPDDVDTQVEPPGTEPTTLRERLEQHRSDPRCAACHAILDPPGLLFENFDSLGLVREFDNGFPVDTSGGIDGFEFADGRGLADYLPTDRRVSACMVKQLYRHANGRLDTPGEAKQLEAIDQQFAESGYRFQDLLLVLATSEGFRSLQTPENAQ
jgi:hypothetical protein